MDYLNYWQLTEKPFEEVRNPRFFYESSDHLEALDRLLYIVHDKNMGLGLLTGEIGSGKTMTRTVLERSLSKHEYEVVGLDSSGLEFNDLLYDVIRSITFLHANVETAGTPLQDRRGDKYYLLDTLKTYVRRLNENEQRHLVIIIDEAQQLSTEALDDIKNLTNLGTEHRNYLTVLLIGQPELRGTIKEMKQVNQRVSLRFHLNNLDMGDTRKYINHRLRVAGCPRENVFSDSAVSELFRATGGVPREINRIAKLVLDYGFAHTLPEIDEKTIQLIIEDLNRHG